MRMRGPIGAGVLKGPEAEPGTEKGVLCPASAAASLRSSMVPRRQTASGFDNSSSARDKRRWIAPSS